MTAPQCSAAPDLHRRTLAVIMAGGNGSRLGELTRWHAKPALPFGGQYRNIDFTLSNCINSGIRRVALLTQYKAYSLIQHVLHGWSFLRPEIGEFVELWPAQQRCGQRWYTGTADAVYQNLDIIDGHAPDYVLVLAGDHIYKMNYLSMIETHVGRRADVTVGCVEVPLKEASAFGVMSLNGQGWVQRFEEKPRKPTPAPYDRDVALASMGIYVFSRRFLADCLHADAADPESNHDFGRDVLPSLVGGARVLAYSFRDTQSGKPAYWRDVGTVDSYWQANMELLREPPGLDLRDPSWPIRTYQPQCAPPRFLGEGLAKRSIVSGGCLVSGVVEHSLLSPNCRVDAGTRLSHSVVLPDVQIGRNCRIERAIIDSGCVIPDGTVIGDDLFDAAERYYVSPGGIVLVTEESSAGDSMSVERKVAAA